MISLRASYALLVLSCAVLPLAFESQDPIVLMWSVACVVIAWLIVGQARDASDESRRSDRS